MKYSSLTKAILSLIPDADIQVENHGQIIIYTGLKRRARNSDDLVSVDNESEEKPSHVCGLSGYNPMLGDTCQACEQR